MQFPAVKRIGYLAGYGLAAGWLLGVSGCKPEGGQAKVKELEKEVKALTAELAEARIAQRDEVESLRKELGKQRQERTEERTRLERERDRAISFLDRVEGRKEENPSREFILDTPGRETAEESAPANPSPIAPASQMTDAIILIEGDKSRGTGFMVRQDGKHYLYTAAHVFSGNSRLTASNTAGRKFTKFGNLEVADGADLVRLQVLEENPGAMLPVKSANGVTVGSEIIALGDGGGAGIVSELKGKIVGLSAESVEVDAGIIQGNSGGPVILAATGEVTPACSPGYLSENGPFTGFRTLAEVSQARFVRSPLEPWSTWFSACGLSLPEPDTGAQCNDLGLVYDAAAAGFGVALVRLDMGAAWFDSGRLIRLSSRSVPSPNPNYICWKPGTMERWECAAFVDWLVQGSGAPRDS